MKHTQKLIVNYRKTWDGKDEFTLFPFLAGDRVRVCEVEVEFETPDDFNPVAAQVAALKEHEAEVVKQFTEKLQEIKEQISKLESLEYSEAA